MRVTYIHHSGFLVETQRCYYLFDYESGNLPKMDGEKPIFVLSSHSHSDHYRPEVFPLLTGLGMTKIRAVLSQEIHPPKEIDVLSVAPGQTYQLAPGQKLTTFRSTDVGVAFLLEDGAQRIYHAGDLHDWIWEEESDSDNARMRADYREQIRLLAAHLGQHSLDAAFVVLDPRQEQDYHWGLCYFLEHIHAPNVYPMHYWDQPGIIERFCREYPQYQFRIQPTESYSAARGNEAHYEI